MSLADLIRKGGNLHVATATSATSATQPGESRGTVARVATVAVANPTKAQTDDEARILDWLARIEETDPEIIAEVLEKCGKDADALAYFLNRAFE